MLIYRNSKLSGLHVTQQHSCYYICLVLGSEVTHSKGRRRLPTLGQEVGNCLLYADATTWKEILYLPKHTAYNYQACQFDFCFEQIGKKKKAKKKPELLLLRSQLFFRPYAISFDKALILLPESAGNKSCFFFLGCSQWSTHLHVEPLLASNRMPAAFVREGHPTRTPLGWAGGLLHVYTPVCSALYWASCFCNNQASSQSNGMKPYPPLPFHM